MSPKEPTRAQLSSRLSYSQNTPAFLRKFSNRVAGVPDEDEDEDDEFEYDGSGRPPIPKRPAIPERPSDQAGSADEDDGDERPQVVVLKEGKHLSQREAENERRKAKGLSPLPEPSGVVPAESHKTLNEAPVKARSKDSLSFSSKAGMKPLASGKRKAVGDPGEHGSKDEGKRTKKKAKKAPRTLLSFADDE
ncbi:hypothetical protein HETIRDRAFT_316683 [Heterobasidion irregulare TC 32-1]|uniref:DUF4604 domain-containing protein n=1 Tax=Heterobasidion irregulare (strain TC 32-1) TaxID=747525 RepID=W4KAJ1_HETIT|nr:uncharacterized protein HETIRDRAFT_316683 [Heterobasidion irregulare TC 32-1]ETW82764.1 hypothetical protein HETIRDRAFT_316683 [Heterobasidion irregulare TC 32-1]